MSDIQDLLQRQAEINTSYHTLLQAQFLPLGDHLKADQLYEWQQSLAEQRYVLAVCGQMKAGKSTLLNALIFGRLVLPADDTVMTAKITIIRYAETPGIKVSYYTQDEWNELKDFYERQRNGNDSYGGQKLYDDFHAELDKAFKEGITEGNLISRHGKEDYENSLEALNKYVSIVDKGGIYSPFVKEVTVYHNNDQFKGVDIVDTPGINDPNVMRTRITTSWIHKADAVLYVSYAGQALAQADKDFIISHLGGVSSERRILILNKMDCVTDPREVKSYVEELRRSSDAETRGIMAPEAQTAYVCSGAALVKRAGLLDTLDERTQEAIEDLEWVLDGSSYLEDENDGFKHLEQVIAERLLATKGADLIRSHQENLSLFKSQVETYFDSISAAFEDEKSRMNLNADELNTLKEQLKNLDRSITKIDMNSQEKLRNANLKSSKLLEDYLNISFNKLFDAFKYEWGSAKDIVFESFVYKAQNDISNAWDNNKGHLNETIERYSVSLLETLNGIITDIEDQAENLAQGIQIRGLKDLNLICLEFEINQRSRLNESQLKCKNDIAEKIEKIEKPKNFVLIKQPEKERIHQHVILTVRNALDGDRDNVGNKKTLYTDIIDGSTEMLNAERSRSIKILRESLTATMTDLDRQIQDRSKSYEERKNDLQSRVKQHEDHQNQVLKIFLSLPSIKAV